MTIRVFAELSSPLSGIPREARECEDLGFDGVAREESAHDPFLPLALAAEHTSKLHLTSAIAVGFARSPMVLAYLAHDLNSLSQGRFTLGIGSQIKPHIERRFSMPWSHPAARMREMVEAIKAIHATWYDGAKLKFEGQFYSHTLMAPMFTPTDIEYGKPGIAVAAVGPLMTQAAAAVGDGMFVHSFTTQTYLRDFTLPNLDQGAVEAGRARAAVRTFCYPFIVTGRTQEQSDALRKATVDQLAFYASTPAYRPVLDAHGWGELQSELQAMTKQGRWDELGDLITDEILETFAVVAEPGDVGAELWRRFGGMIDDFGLGSFGILDRELLAGIAGDVRAAAKATAS